MELRGHLFEHVVRAQPLLEEALTLAPDEPSILSTYASLLLRRAFIERSQTNALIARARAVAEHALRGAPHMAEPLVELARVDYHEGAPVAMVQKLRRALALAPGLAHAHEVLGRILTETGPIERAVHHLEAALALDPTVLFAGWDLVRAHALAGAWDLSQAALDGLAEAPLVFRLYHRARLTLWRRTAPDYQPLPVTATTDPGSPAPMIAAYHRMGTLGRLDDADTRVFTDYAAQAPPGSRSRPFMYQLAAEALAWGRRDADAIAAITAAVDGGLIDVVWMNRCPLFDDLRTDPRFQEQLARTEARAAPIRAALDEPLSLTE
jgi:serine/threonine-protein kinase